MSPEYVTRLVASNVITQGRWQRRRLWLRLRQSGCSIPLPSPVPSRVPHRHLHSCTGYASALHTTRTCAALAPHTAFTRALGRARIRIRASIRAASPPACVHVHTYTCIADGGHAGSLERHTPGGSRIARSFLPVGTWGMSLRLSTMYHELFDSFFFKNCI